MRRRNRHRDGCAWNRRLQPRLQPPISRLKAAVPRVWTTFSRVSFGCGYAAMRSRHSTQAFNLPLHMYENAHAKPPAPLSSKAATKRDSRVGCSNLRYRRLWAAYWQAEACGTADVVAPSKQLPLSHHTLRLPVTVTSATSFPS